MTPRRWTDSLGPPLLAFAAVVVLVVPALAGPARSLAGGRPSVVAASRPADLAPCTASPPADVREVAAAWYRLDPIIGASGGLDGQRLAAGQVGRRGEVGLPLAVESFAAGPSAGRILVGSDDGRRSIVRILDVGRRCAIVVHEGPELIRRAVLDPLGGVVEFRLDRLSRADLGTWSRPLDGSEPRQLLEPLPPNDRIGRVFATELSWSVDRSRLVVTSCGEASCLARILDRSSGRVTTVDDPRVGEVLGLAGDDLLAYGGCPTLPCEIVAMDLPTGRIRVLASHAGLADVSILNGEAVVAFEDVRTDGRLRVVRLDGSRLRTLALPGGLRLVPSAPRALAAIELPAGVIALAEGGRPSRRGAHVAFINLANGRRVPPAEVVR